MNQSCIRNPEPMCAINEVRDYTVKLIISRLFGLELHASPHTVYKEQKVPEGT